MNKCTCGVKFTGGLCSSWCDSLRPDEPAPDTQPDRAKLYFGTFISPSWAAARSARAKSNPAPTPYGDGTNALDEVCVCGCYIMRPDKNYVPPDGSLHGTRACLDKYGKSHWRSPAPKP